MKFSVLKQRLEEHYNGFQDNRGKRKLAVELRKYMTSGWQIQLNLLTADQSIRKEA